MLLCAKKTLNQTIFLENKLLLSSNFLKSKGSHRTLEMVELAADRSFTVVYKTSPDVIPHKRPARF